VIYVKISGEAIYSILDWKTWVSVAYAAGAVALMYGGYGIGYWFGWLRTGGSQGAKKHEEIRDYHVDIIDGKSQVELMPTSSGVILGV
jgi:hypothetical protein